LRRAYDAVEEETDQTFPYGNIRRGLDLAAPLIVAAAFRAFADELERMREQGDRGSFGLAVAIERARAHAAEVDGGAQLAFRVGEREALRRVGQ